MWISLKITLTFVPKVPNNNIPALDQIMAWHRLGDKPFSEPMMVSLLQDIRVTRPQWVKAYIIPRCDFYQKNISHVFAQKRWQNPHAFLKHVLKYNKILFIFHLRNTRFRENGNLLEFVTLTTICSWSHWILTMIGVCDICSVTAYREWWIVCWNYMQNFKCVLDV